MTCDNLTLITKNWGSIYCWSRNYDHVDCCKKSFTCWVNYEYRWLQFKTLDSFYKSNIENNFDFLLWIDFIRTRNRTWVGRNMSSLLIRKTSSKLSIIKLNLALTTRFVDVKNQDRCQSRTSCTCWGQVNAIFRTFSSLSTFWHLSTILNRGLLTFLSYKIETSKNYHHI